MPFAYYNEIDPIAAQWLRNLIAAGELPPGDVDERSILEVRPNDLKSYTQCHFFAGIGGWPLALRRARWPDGRRVWSASCPCQPFSVAGDGLAFADERHLWPVAFNLASQCDVTEIIGEQVASRDAGPWLDLVLADLEGLGFAVGAVAFPSAGVGAPHMRDRTYWAARRMGYAYVAGPQGHAGHDGDPWGGPGSRGPITEASVPLRVADATRRGCGIVGGSMGSGEIRHVDGGSDAPSGERPGPTNGAWGVVDWLACRDGNWRPVEPGTFPLATEIPARVGRLRAYGNAINIEQAATFIEAFA